MSKNEAVKTYIRNTILDVVSVKVEAMTLQQHQQLRMNDGEPRDGYRLTDNDGKICWIPKDKFDSEYTFVQGTE